MYSEKRYASFDNRKAIPMKSSYDSVNSDLILVEEVSLDDIEGFGVHRAYQESTCYD